jgi:hypothetical protein
MEHTPLGETSIVCSWRIKDKRAGRWRTLRWKMTDADAAQWAAREGVEIEKLPGTDEERQGYGIMPSGRVQRKPGVEF